MSAGRRSCPFFPRLVVGASLLCLSVAGWSTSASAYRPFKGTDAAVVDPGQWEIELQPAGVLRDGQEKTLIAPGTVLNIGLTEGWEAVFEGEGHHPLSSAGRSSLKAPAPSSSTSCDPAVCKIRLARASRPNLERFCQVLTPIVALARAWLESCRSAGNGRPYT